MPRLPPELTDRAIDHLHSDKPALLACSLVCKTWLHASRYHLFHIEIPLTDRNIRSFVELLDSPTSTFFGQALHVHISPCEDSHKPLSASAIFGTISRYLLKLKIKSLRLTDVEWDIKDKELEEMFEYFATTTTLDLRDVTFSIPNQYIKFITSFLSLEKLCLYGISTPADDASHITPFTLSPLLRAVDLCSQDLKPPFTWFLSAAQFPPVESLHIFSIKSEHLDAIQAVLQSLGSSLNTICLVFSNPGALILRPIGVCLIVLVIQRTVVLSI
jgi:hypothetical protein